MKTIINKISLLRKLIAILFFMNIAYYSNAQFTISPYVAPYTYNYVTTPIYIAGTNLTGMYLGNRSWTSNTVFGVNGLVANVGGHDNTAIGASTLTLSTSASSNTAIGSLALTLATGSGNTCIGNSSGAGYTFGLANTGINNSALGYATLARIESGSNNSALGYLAMTNDKDGNSNTGIGNASTGALTTGNFNAALGALSLGSLANGNNNVALGGSALFNLASGDNNIGIGFNTNAVSTTGSDQLNIQNIIYGRNMTGSNGYIGLCTNPAGTAVNGTLPAGTFSRLHILGNGIAPPLQLDNVPNYTGALPVTNPSGIGTGRYLFIDAAGVVSQALVPTGVTNCGNVNFIPVTNNVNGNMTCSQIFDNGNSVGISQTAGFTFTAGLSTTLTPGSPGAPIPTNFRLGVNGWVSATAYTSLSDQRIKKDIKKIENPLEKILKISGYTYYWNKDYKTDRKLDDNKQVGFLAQEVFKVLPEAVVKSEDGLYGLNYNAIMPLLAEGIKEQQSQIETQQLKIEELETKVNELNDKLNRLVPGDVKIKNANFDITPNPITGVSTVSYKLDNANAGSYFAVYDLQGKLLKQISLAKNTNEGQVQIRKTDFKNGMYILALISNNNEIESKRFIISQ